MNCLKNNTLLYQEFIDTAMSDSSLRDFKSIVKDIEGMEESDISSISNSLEGMFDINLSDKEAKDEKERLKDPDGQTSLEKEAEEVTGKIKGRIQANMLAEKEAIASGVESLIAEGHVVQDSAEVLEIVEPTSPDTLFTTPIDLQKASYSLKEDYPDTYGFIDTVKNWYKVNKKKKYSEYVHASGSVLKMDKAGNTTIEIKGKLKLIQRGEMTHFVGDNLDISIDGNFYHHIMGELKQIIDENASQTISGDNTIKVTGKMKTNATRIDLN